MNDQLNTNQALLEKKLKVVEATIKFKSKLLESHQEFYVRESLAHEKATIEAKRGKMSKDMLQP